MRVVRELVVPAAVEVHSRKRGALGNGCRSRSVGDGLRRREIGFEGGSEGLGGDGKDEEEASSHGSSWRIERSV